MKGIALFTLSLIVGVGSSNAAEFPLYRPLFDVAIMEPPDPPPPGGVRAYHMSGTNPTWWVAQWNIPGGKLPPFSRTVQDGAVTLRSEAKESSVTIVQIDGAASYQLAQDGAYLPCNRQGQPFESDLLMNTFGSDAAPPARSAYLAPSPVALSNLSALYQVANVAVESAAPKTTKRCDISQGTVLLAVVLRNPTAKQTFFYQLSLDLVCGPFQLEKRQALCESRQRHPEAGYFFTSNPFGADDWLPLITGSWIGPGTNHLKVDILPRIRELIAKGPEAMDRNPAHWVIGSSFHGQHIWGDLRMSSNWSDVNLIAAQ
jgi:hypothetical protein